VSQNTLPRVAPLAPQQLHQGLKCNKKNLVKYMTYIYIYIYILNYNKYTLASLSCYCALYSHVSNVPQQIYEDGTAFRS